MNNQLLTRRAFFHHGVKKVLPILGMVLLNTIPKVQAASVVTDCKAMCAGACSVTCQGTCTGACAVACGGACVHTCQYRCSSTCTTGCQGFCKETCKGSAKNLNDTITIPIDTLKVK